MNTLTSFGILGRVSLLSLYFCTGHAPLTSLNRSVKAEMIASWSGLSNTWLSSSTRYSLTLGPCHGSSSLPSHASTPSTLRISTSCSCKAHKPHQTCVREREREREHSPSIVVASNSANRFDLNLMILNSDILVFLSNKYYIT